MTERIDHLAQNTACTLVDFGTNFMTNEAYHYARILIFVGIALTIYFAVVKHRL